MSHEIPSPEDPDITLPGTPLAIIVRAEFVRFRHDLSGDLAKMEARVAAAVVHAVTPRMRDVELAQKVTEARSVANEQEIRTLRSDIDDLRERFDDFCRRHADTSMLPPPPSGDG